MTEREEVLLKALFVLLRERTRGNPGHTVSIDQTILDEVSHDDLDTIVISRKDVGATEFRIRNAVHRIELSPADEWPVFLEVTDGSRSVRLRVPAK